VQYVISIIGNTYCVCTMMSDMIQMKQWIQLLQKTVYYWSINQFENSSCSCTVQHISQSLYIHRATHLTADTAKPDMAVT